MIYPVMNIINAMDTKAAGAWLEKMYLEWQLDQGGRRKSIATFAEYLGSSQSFVSQVMAGKRTPSSDTALDWALKLDDDEILDILEIPRDELEDKRRLKLFQAAYYATPKDKQEDLVRLVKDFLEQYGSTVEDEQSSSDQENQSGIDPDR